MECNYQVVENEIIKKSNWKSFCRQVHIISGVWTMLYIAGLCSGAPTVFIPQIRKEKNHIIDDDVASWLYSVSNITAIPWVLILPSLTWYAGRKPVYILTCLANLVVFIILYLSTSPYEILAAEVVQGFVNGSNITIMALMLSEYSSPKYRGIFSTITSTSFYFGIWTSNTIGTYFYWKYIAVLGVVCTAYSFTVAISPESPIWLASKGKFKESEKVFKWLNDISEESNTELNDFMKSQMDYRAKIVMARKNEGIIASFKRKEFYKPLILCILIGAQYNFSGKLVCSAYVIEVISKITDSQQAAHSGMLILDGFTILGMYFGSFLAKNLKRRTLYFTSAFIGVLFLLIISLYLYLVKLLVLTENSVITILLLVAYSLSISCGTVTMFITIYTEIIPIRYQTSCYMIISLCYIGLTSALLKLAPITFKYLGMHGSFSFYGITCGAITIILYLYLPETKGMTLLEIEEHFKDKCNLKQNQKLVNKQ